MLDLTLECKRSDYRHQHNLFFCTYEDLQFSLDSEEKVFLRDIEKTFPIDF